MSSFFETPLAFHASGAPVLAFNFLPQHLCCWEAHAGAGALGLQSTLAHTALSHLLFGMRKLSEVISCLFAPYNHSTFAGPIILCRWFSVWSSHITNANSQTPAPPGPTGSVLGWGGDPHTLQCDSDAGQVQIHRARTPSADLHTLSTHLFTYSHSSAKNFP